MSKPLEKIFLSICIVNWNSTAFLIRCIRSIFQAHLPFPFEVIVVDNQSSERGIECFARQIDEVKVVFAASNDGFAAGNNLALQRATGNLVLLLNPDTMVTSEAVEEMARLIVRKKRVGFCGCHIVHPETLQTELSVRKDPGLLRLALHLFYLDRLKVFSGLNNAFILRHLPTGGQPKRVDWMTGACLMARKSVLEEIGGLDDDYFMYAEDIDACFSTRLKGYENWFVPYVSIYHYRGRSSRHQSRDHADSLSQWGAQQYVRSMLIFFRKHFGNRQVVVLRWIFALSSIFKGCLWAAVSVHPRRRKDAKVRCVSFLSAVPVAVAFDPNGPDR